MLSRSLWAVRQMMLLRRARLLRILKLVQMPLLLVWQTLQSQNLPRLWNPLQMLRLLPVCQMLPSLTPQRL